ncbi:flavin reductase family protein [Alkalicoccus chagannorensis]|uniref:flavin reductase family protein n=1 Tax=Alkalicoccus chagannorensis TaxID=427072 RepID=UPI00040C3AE6|nr:flavin reductase family protein [Alkalicoccus chagannorensis]
MAAFSSEGLSKQEQHRLLTSIVAPRPIAFVSTMSEDGVLNAAPFSYFNIVSAEPPLLSISIGRKKGQQKDTARNILQKKEFVVHVTDEDNVKKVNKTAASLSPDESEAAFASLTPTVSHQTGVPSIKESTVRMECVLEQHLVIGDENSVVDLIIGRIRHYDIEDKLIKDGSVRTDKMKPVARLGGKEYARLGHVFELERPD